MSQFKIIPARTPTEISSTRDLFTTYASTLNINLDFQNFSTELASLPGLYAPPTGEIYLAYPSAAVDNKIVEPLGCVAIRPLKVLSTT
jgi:putative acetyltransferase